jgi:hypothetical protein
MAHDMKESSSEINFHLTRSKGTKFKKKLLSLVVSLSTSTPSTVLTLVSYLSKNLMRAVIRIIYIYTHCWGTCL